MSEIMVDGFMKPYAEEKARMSGGAIR